MQFDCALILAVLDPAPNALLVDNCEHVVDAAAVLVDDILSRCPGITVVSSVGTGTPLPSR